MWINQPSKFDAHHALHGTNVLAIHEYDSTWRIYFLSGNTISQQVHKHALSIGWRPEREAPPKEEVVETVKGLHKALSRMIDIHDPDSMEAEWLSHSNELVRKLTGYDVRT
jgi:hypothetical protein